MPGKMDMRHRRRLRMGCRTGDEEARRPNEQLNSSNHGLSFEYEVLAGKGPCGVDGALVVRTSCVGGGENAA